MSFCVRPSVCSSVMFLAVFLSVCNCVALMCLSLTLSLYTDGGKHFCNGDAPASEVSCKFTQDCLNSSMIVVVSIKTCRRLVSK